jgi:bifunctional non-homologous end joining protein LigD
VLGIEPVHRPKFDGYRVQAHRWKGGAALFSRNGYSFDGRYPGLAHAVRELPAKSAIIDGELVAVSSRGLPNFPALHLRSAAPESICLWAFDLLHLDGKDLHDLPLARRREKLERLIERFDYPLVRFSETFDDAAALLRSCEAHQLEGIVIKRQDAPYRSGPQTSWVKIKTTAWREANRERWRMFQAAR